MLTQLLDVFGFLSVLLRGLILALTCLLLGGVSFTLWILPSSASEAVWQPCRRLVVWSATALAITHFCCVELNTAILGGTAGLPLREIAGANFFIVGLAGISAATAIACMAARNRRPS